MDIQPHVCAQALPAHVKSSRGCFGASTPLNPPVGGAPGEGGGGNPRNIPRSVLNPSRADRLRGLVVDGRDYIGLDEAMGP